MAEDSDPVAPEEAHFISKKSRKAELPAGTALRVGAHRQRFKDLAVNVIRHGDLGSETTDPNVIENVRLTSFIEALLKEIRVLMLHRERSPEEISEEDLLQTVGLIEEVVAFLSLERNVMAVSLGGESIWDEFLALFDQDKRQLLAEMRKIDQFNQKLAPLRIELEKTLKKIHKKTESKGPVMKSPKPTHDTNAIQEVVTVQPHVPALVEPKEMPKPKGIIDLTVSLANGLHESIHAIRKSIVRYFDSDSVETDAIPEQGQLNERLQALVVEPIDRLPEAERTLKGKVRSGEEIARAIPDVEAFLAQVDGMKEAKFFEINKKGQLVMMDGCKEAYGLGEDFRQAEKRQTQIVYRLKDGTVLVVGGDDYFSADVNGNLVLSNAAKRIDPNSILMEKGLPTLHRDGGNHTGEYARMNGNGQFEITKLTWTKDKSLDSSRARFADWTRIGYMDSVVRGSNRRGDDLGSRGVLRVNLNFED